MQIESDAYFNKPEKFQNYQDMGVDCIPVDINGGYVQPSKEKSSLEDAQDTIRKRI